MHEEREYHERGPTSILGSDEFLDTARSTLKHPRPQTRRHKGFTLIELVM
jgi:hypothetical protein